MKTSHLFSLFIALGLLITPLANAESEVEKTPLTSSIEAIIVSDDGEAKVSWSIEGENQMGVKVLSSTSKNPIYPARDGDNAVYIADKDQQSSFIKAFDGAGTYYIRVCEYLDGVCGTYSNEISIELAEQLRTVKEKMQKQFSDISEKSDVYDAASYLKEKAYIKGYEDGSFKPNQKINRAEFLKIVMEASGHTPSGTNCFKDVNNEWHAPYICKAKALNQIAGYEDGNFRPEQEIVYAEAAKIIVNLLALESKDSNNENWYHRYVSAMELLSAIPTSVESFEKPITRGEMAEMIYRIHAKKKNKASKSYKELKAKKAQVSGEKSVQSLTLFNKAEGKVGWDVDGYAAQGFKVIWSKISQPEYPVRSVDQAQYVGDPEQHYAFLKGFDGEGEYFVRVCEYLDGSCGVYSNEVTIELKEQKK